MRYPRVGDRVKLVSGQWGDSHNNPVWGGEYGKIQGTITSINSDRIADDFDLPCSVLWDNNEVNDYEFDDLMIDEVFKISLPEDLFKV